MRSKKHLIAGTFAAITMFILMIDATTVAKGAKEGIELCIYTIIPALFPFFVISGIVSAAFTGRPIILLRPLASVCRIPVGSESLLLLGLVGGYPVGAKAIIDSYRCGSLTKSDALRLLRFCNNAGPSFIFGLIAASFSSAKAVWCVWCIQILSAILVGILSPGQAESKAVAAKSVQISIPSIMKNALQATGTVCGFVILFRTLLTTLTSNLRLPVSPLIQIIWAGILELTNGCCQLNCIADEGLRFLITNCLLSFGGLCVMMQTAGFTEELGIRTYISGKLLQTLITFIIAGVACYFLYPTRNTAYFYFFIPALFGVIVHILWNFRKNSSKIAASVV